MPHLFILQITILQFLKSISSIHVNNHEDDNTNEQRNPENK